jgi:hypothetical protein
MDIKEIGHECVNWIQLAHYRHQWWAVYDNETSDVTKGRGFIY